MEGFHPGAHLDFDPNDKRPLLVPDRDQFPSADGYDQPGFAIPHDGDFFDHRQPQTGHGPTEKAYLYK